MPVYVPFRSISLRDAALGSLVSVMSDDTMVLAIKLHQDFDGILLGVLGDGGDEFSPRLQRVQDYASCADFGKDVLFEVGMPQGEHNGETVDGIPGSFTIDESGPWLWFGPDSKKPQEVGVYLNIALMKSGRPSGRRILTNSWRLWASAAERDRIGGVPLIDRF